MYRIINGVKTEETAADIDQRLQAKVDYDIGQSQRDRDEAITLRSTRYKSEADPYFLEALRKGRAGDAAGEAAANALGDAAVTLIQTEIPIPIV